MTFGVREVLREKLVALAKGLRVGVDVADFLHCRGFVGFLGYVVVPMVAEQAVVDWEAGFSAYA